MLLFILFFVIPALFASFYISKFKTLLRVLVQDPGLPAQLIFYDLIFKKSINFSRIYTEFIIILYLFLFPFCGILFNTVAADSVCTLLITMQKGFYI